MMGFAALNPSYAGFRLLMISNHYPLLHATRYNWIIVAIVLALGPIIRHLMPA